MDLQVVTPADWEGHLGIHAPLTVMKWQCDRCNEAYLYDRVAVNSGRPQRYGTQGRCTPAGVWEPREVEPPEKLAGRTCGYPPEADYIAVFNYTGAPRG